MSYIRANRVDQEEPVTVEHGFRMPEVDFQARPTIDASMDNEMLDFVLDLIGQVSDLAEGEALVVWKEIF